MITFIIPTYNAQKHLRTCLESIRTQDYPQEQVEILIIDGGSTDSTLQIAQEYNVNILVNPLKLAEYGVQIGMKSAKGNYVVVFASDNELIGKDWVEKVITKFYLNAPADEETIGSWVGMKGLSALWGKIASKTRGINKYYALIQNDPLTWFLNQNMKYYNWQKYPENYYFMFCVYPEKPLVWGANGLVYRKSAIQDIWDTPDYLGDNDAFQTMIEKGRNFVGFYLGDFVYHHHIESLRDWIKKWQRNFTKHYLAQRKTRNMRWVCSNFRKRLLLWFLYLPFSFIHSVYLALKERKIEWLYHFPCCITQTLVYGIEYIKWKIQTLTKPLND